ncbi:DUF3052 domain-containing protein [Streptomyces sp. NPDC051546]|uniref:DUF3052 domain-containing protein n=1 Tax=Streptomyces sp. NPDC051546 TaxID=3365655 RepID=UPI0037941F40
MEASVTAAQDETTNAAEELGFTAGQTVQETGHGQDSDEGLRESIQSVTGTELVDEDYEDVADVVLLWWREEDGDLTDTLADAVASLADEGHVWLLTPETGREGSIDATDITEAAQTVGLNVTESRGAGPHWTASRLASPKARR